MVRRGPDLYHARSHHRRAREILSTGDPPPDTPIDRAMLTSALSTSAPFLALLPEGEGAAPAGPNMFVILAGTLVIFYLVAFLPERKARKKKEAMLNAVKKNDRVLTTSGMFATVAALGEQDLTIKFDDGNTRVRILRSSISAVLDKDGEEAG